jgi:hypothetical protein
MATNWTLIREAMSGVIDACEALEKLPIDDPEYWRARSDFQADVDVADFLTRFWQYPEGSARDVVRLRAALGCDAKHPNPLARALVNAAAACAEAVGVPEEKLSTEVEGFEPHCGSAGKSIESQLRAPAGIAAKWMVPGIAKAIEQARKKA